MDIRSAIITDFSTGTLSLSAAEGLTHVKALPCMSVVQSLRGRYDVSLDGGESEKMNAGDIFVAPPRLMQTIVHHMDETGKMEARWIFFNAETDGIPVDSRFDFPLRCSPAAAREISPFLDGIFSSRDLFFRLASAYMLLRYLLDEAQEKRRQPRGIAAALALIRTRFGEPLSVPELAAEAKMSLSSFHASFRQTVGMPPLAYLNEYRLSRALGELLHTDCTVSEAARRSGFPDPLYFSRVFREKYGMSPRQYRSDYLLSAGKAGGKEPSSQTLAPNPRKMRP